VVQTAAKLILEPIFEADLDDAAHGYDACKTSCGDATRCGATAGNASTPATWSGNWGW